eukprot:403333102
MKLSDISYYPIKIYNKKLLLILLLCISAQILVPVTGKQRGKTYDDLQDMLNKANQKMEDEQERQHFSDGKEHNDQFVLHNETSTPETSKNQPSQSSQNQQNKIPTLTNEYNTLSLPKNAPTASQNNQKSNQASKISAPDNYRASQQIPKKNSRIDDLAAELAKKKNTETQDSVKLRSVTIPRKTSENEKLYFLLSNVILLLTCLIIIGACFVMVYFVYRQLFSREQYFQFDDEPPRRSINPNDVLTIDDIKKIGQAVGYDEFNRKSDSTVERENVNEDDNKFKFEQQQNNDYDQHNNQHIKIESDLEIGVGGVKGQIQANSQESTKQFQNNLQQQQQNQSNVNQYLGQPQSQHLNAQRNQINQRAIPQQKANNNKTNKIQNLLNRR